MLTEVPVPGITRLQQAAATYQQQHAACYYSDLLRAHAAAGLLRQLTIQHSVQTTAAAAAGNAAGDGKKADLQQQQQQQQHTAWAFASLSPYKDMEVVVVGGHLCCPAFQRLMHAALRAMIDGCGCRTFNAGVLNVELAAAAPAGVGPERQFWRGTSAGSSEVSSSKGHDDCSSSVSGGSSMSVSSLASSSSSSSSNLACSTNGSDTGSGNRYHYYDVSGSSNSSSSSGEAAVPNEWPWGNRPPVLARLVSRGKLSSVASDFGCLEVFGGASIGHSDPYLVVQQLDEQFAPAGVPE
jgi:hypothetical protein